MTVRSYWNAYFIKRCIFSTTVQNVFNRYKFAGIIDVKILILYFFRLNRTFYYGSTIVIKRFKG